MRLYNPATGATTDQPEKSLHVWAGLGWLPVEERHEDEDTAEATAEDTARGHHPSAKATKDK